MQPATANLIAPLVINLRTRQAVQAIVCEGITLTVMSSRLSSPEAVCSLMRRRQGEPF